jgi:hypothetical protein
MEISEARHRELVAMLCQHLGSRVAPPEDTGATQAVSGGAPSLPPSLKPTPPPIEIWGPEDRMFQSQRKRDAAGPTEREGQEGKADAPGWGLGTVELAEMCQRLIRLLGFPSPTSANVRSFIAWLGTLPPGAGAR